ncbi:hypothetical protein FQZ97_1153390 [compost metagenome]
MSRSFCSMKATFFTGLVTSSPLTYTSPTVGRYKPAPMFSSVLLPQPDGPMMETTSPLRMAMLTLVTAERGCEVCRSMKLLPTLRNSISIIISLTIMCSTYKTALRMWVVM